MVSLGDLALATRAYTMTVIVFAWVWSFALGIGTQIKVAHQIGARRFDEADRQLHGSLRRGSWRSVRPCSGWVSRWSRRAPAT